MKPRGLSKEVLEKWKAERQTALNSKAFDHGACALCLLKTHYRDYDSPLPGTTGVKGCKSSGLMASEIAHQQPTAKVNRHQIDAGFRREYLKLHEYLGSGCLVSRSIGGITQVVRWVTGTINLLTESF